MLATMMHKNDGFFLSGNTKEDQKQLQKYSRSYFSME